MPFGTWTEVLALLDVDVPQRSQNLADIMGQVIHPFEEALFQRRAEGFVELAHATGLRVQIKKLETKQWRENIRQRRRHFLSGYGRLQDLKQPRLVFHPPSARTLGNT